MNSASTGLGGWKVPSPLPRATSTPASPNPTRSALPSPVRSATKRGCWSTRQPWLYPRSIEHEFRRLESAVAVAQRGPDAVVAEPDDVGLAVSGEVSDEARVLIDAPALVVPQVHEHEFHAARRCRPRCCSAVQTPASPKPTMSARPSPVRSARNADMVFDPPAGVEVESVKDHVRRLEAAVAVAERGPDAVKPEPDDVRFAVSGEIGDQTRLLRAPTLTTPAHFAFPLVRYPRVMPS